MGRSGDQSLLVGAALCGRQIWESAEGLPYISFMKARRGGPLWPPDPGLQAYRFRVGAHGGAPLRSSCKRVNGK
jgi:hypothetical protein